MAQRTLQVLSANADEKMISVTDRTTVREILRQFDKDDGPDRAASLIRGVTLLEPHMTISEAGLEDRDEVSIVFYEPTLVEMPRWTGQRMDQDLYVQIPPGTRRIDAFAFSDCKALVKVVIPNSVTNIGRQAFDGCSSLTQVAIPNSVTSIGAQAFAFCTSLREVKIPDSVTSIETGCFRDCSSLTHVKIPNSVTSIEWGAFANCVSLTEVELPIKSTLPSYGAFAGCNWRIQQKAAKLDCTLPAGNLKVERRRRRLGSSCNSSSLHM